MPSFYRLLTLLAAPFIALYLRLRRAKGKEDKARFQERLGHASLRRPSSGKLIWCHAASVGEALCVLSLLDRLTKKHPLWSVLLTTGTVTSANLVASRLPERTLHQYAPVDRWPYVSRFLDHWKPDLVLWVESELWPNMLGAIAQRQIPAVLLNGRMSERSYRRWRLVPKGIAEILSAFTLGLAQTGAERARLAALGLRDCRALGNLKFAADPLPCDEGELMRLRDTIGSRPVWLMASTHAGEDEIALRTHKVLRRHWPDLLTIIVPRHPARSDDIAGLIVKEGLTAARRAKGEAITADTAIYLADTMGEMGLFYRLCKLCCLAGSFTWGGHNPVEPALLGCTVLFGPKMDNFLVMADDMLGSAAALQVMDETELHETLARLLSAPDEADRLAQTAQAWAQAKHKVLDETLALIEPLLIAQETR